LKYLYIIALTICSKLTVGQDINLIIQVNERLEQSNFSNIYVTLDTIVNHRKYMVDYIPGNLKLSSDLLKILETDSSKSIMLHFTYNTYKKDNHQTQHFFAPLTPNQMRQSYLILNIYDFRDKKYKTWYQKNKKQEFVSELSYPNSGILIRNR